MTYNVQKADETQDLIMGRPTWNEAKWGHMPQHSSPQLSRPTLRRRSEKLTSPQLWIPMVQQILWFRLAICRERLLTQAVSCAINWFSAAMLASESGLMFTCHAISLGYLQFRQHSSGYTERFNTVRTQPFLICDCQLYAFKVYLFLLLMTSPDVICM